MGGENVTDSTMMSEATKTACFKTVIPFHSEVSHWLEWAIVCHHAFLSFDSEKSKIILYWPKTAWMGYLETIGKYYMVIYFVYVNVYIFVCVMLYVYVKLHINWLFVIFIDKYIQFISYQMFIDIQIYI